MVLKLLGRLIEPTDRYSTKSHRISAIVLTKLIKIVVSSFMPAAFITLSYLAYNYQKFYLLTTQVWTSHQWLLAIATVWSLFEIGFYLYCLNVKRKFSGTSATLEMNWAKRLYYLQRVLDHNPTVFKSLARWFHTRDIYLDDFEDWFSWAFFNKLKGKLTQDELCELQEIMDISVGRDASLDALKNKRTVTKKSSDFMRLNLDPIVFQHKPLIAYMVISLMQLYGLIFLYCIGFTHYNCQPRSTLSYWIYNGNGSKSSLDEMKRSSKPPVFFVYGIGIGVTMYLKVINGIRNAYPDRTIVVLDLPHISLKLVHEIPSLTLTLDSIDNIFKKHKLTACSWLGHSYGSIVTAWVVKLRPEYIEKVSLVDPVCFALWEPDLIRNFLYNSNPIGPIHHLAQYFVARDLLVASTLFRHFWWLQNILFPDDLTCETYVYFSQYDWIIDSYAIKDYLDTFCSKNSWKRLKTLMMNNVGHGGFISSDEKIEIVVKFL